MPQPGPLHVTLPSFLGIVLPPSPSGAYFDDTNLPAPRSRWGNFGAYFIIKIRYLCREGTIDICSIIFNIINRWFSTIFVKVHACPQKIENKSTKNREKSHKTLIKKRIRVYHYTLSSLSHEIQEIYQNHRFLWSRTHLFYLPSPSSPSWILYANSKPLPSFLNLPKHL